ncbi:dihydropyrimidinase [Treponema phagedenis]|uniref:D-stereospecific phenylhydantoinase n=1 Tax=Treponema phagedenis TaxID=162 RepID=A0A0B7GRA5_TREPH|nr:dihydropyrimidinase [Treponema phagedenis]QEJ95899.1 dihydropyrimidinase [Treponema phagedenis]QEJ98903.1 dihydropyrimidinase [Treponema phagedenis]QEK00403.1 dihydropyrimidinase [Treponema phagedenis]QEK04412.1 dihydropyrimidinase [Treponema phagedenis]QEK05413.1 dihydropyrimidinase [Treponema phagedenis]
MNILIKNGTIVTDSEVKKADVFIEGEVIAGIGDFAHKEKTCEAVYDAAGLYVMPGLIDPHTHMELKQSETYTSVDDFYTGTIAAACGGTTMIIDHIAFGPQGCNLHYSLNNYKELGKKSVVDYSFHGVIQHVDDSILEELYDIVKNEGIASFKAYSTYGYAMNEVDFYKIIEVMKKAGGLLTIHCENDKITNYLRNKFVSENKISPIYHAYSRPNEAEAESVDELLNLAKLIGDGPIYIVHTSAHESVERIRLGRALGQKNLYAETCTQYLTLTEEKYFEDGDEEGMKYLMAPPLRKKADRESLWNALEDKTLQVVATDHCPFNLKRDKLPHIKNFTASPGGAPGVEERPMVVFSEGVMKGRMSLNRFVEVMSTNAAKIFGMYPKKGALKVGSDADITIIDPNRKKTISVKTQHSVCDYNTYEGFESKCSIAMVFLRGKLVAQYGKFLGKKGDGAFVFRKREQAYAAVR